MADYRIEFVPHARRDFAKLPRPLKKRIARHIDALGVDPRPQGAEILSRRTERVWRIRVGDYRVLYEIRDNVLVVLVIRIAHRREVYR